MQRLWSRPLLSITLATIGALTGWQPAALCGQAGQPSKPESETELKIVVLEGEDGVNVIKKKTAVRPVVEVRDKNNSPVAGAAVVFLLPEYGPSGTFLNGSKMVTVMTDSTGRATASAFQPSGAGQFKMSVTASHQGRTATTAITQTNQLGAAAGMSAGAIAAIVGVAAGAAVGIAVGLGGGGNNQQTPADTTPRASIGAGGGPVFGPPR
jgi:hypothetical protein